MATAVAAAYATSAILLIFAIALVGALLPLYLVSTPAPQAVFRYGNAFAAGFLVAAALVHLLPAADRKLVALHTGHYPVSGLLALIGATCVFSLDHVLRRRFATPHIHNITHKDTTSLLPLLPSRPPSPALAYILAAALSLHSLVEGLALGASALHSASFAALLVAILAHKLFAALSVGTSLANAAADTPSARVAALAVAVIFAALTPLGAVLGLAAVSRWLPGAQAELTSVVLSCVSAGIFLYVGFVELLAEEFRESEQDVVGRATVFVAAAAAMSALAVWT